MTRLCDAELRAVNSPLRRFVQRRIEFPVFRSLGLKEQGLDILEVGCGSGYGAFLLSRLKPKSYVGIDLMPEMIDLARKRKDVPNAEFRVMDASDMGQIPDASKDVAVIFDILHHIPRWREVLSECGRVLRLGGAIFLEEPSGSAVRLWDFFFNWGHPKDAMFTWQELEARLNEVGFTAKRRCRLWPLRSYCAVKTPHL
ncbi:MAG: class I SAM-dependent methyltransferase [Thermoguttaceae bacterium]